ncbi:MAG: oligosaccharide flippase family protein [Longimicrobiales bacterium]
MSASHSLADRVNRSAAAEGVRRVLANGISLLLAYVLPRFFTVGAVILAARVLGTGRFGAYGTAAAFAVILSIVATLGMSPLLVREMAKSPDLAAGLLRTAHRVKTMSNVLMLAALYVLGRWIFAYPPAVLTGAMLLGLAYAIAAYTENLSAYFQSIERMHVWTQASAAYGLVTGVAGAALVVTTGSVVAFCAAPIAGQLAALSWLLYRLPRGMRSNTDAVAARWLIRALGPFTAAFVALTLHSKLDVLVLAHWRSPAEVGLYTAGYKFIDLTQALAVVLAAAVYPRLSRVAPANALRGRWAGTRLAELAVLAAALAATTLVVARAPIVALLFGDAYVATAAILAFLGIAVPALVLNIVGGYVLAATGHMRDVALLYGCAVVFKLILNLVLVPGQGATGAAISMLVTELGLAAGMLFLLRSRVAASPGTRTFAAVLGAAAVMAGALLVPDPTHGVLAATLCTGIILMLYNVAGVVPREDRAVLLEAIGLGRSGVRP